MNTTPRTLSEALRIAQQKQQEQQLAFDKENQRRETVVSELKEELTKAGFTFESVEPTALRFGTSDYPNRYFGTHHWCGVSVGFNACGSAPIAFGNAKEVVQGLLNHIAQLGS